jgi:uncharacterized protein YndB with AHSA1/START domain
MSSPGNRRRCSDVQHRLQHRCQRPAPAVFAFVADPAKIPKWRPEITRVEGPAGALREGSEFVESFSLMGPKTNRMRVMAFEPGRRLVIRAIAGPMFRPTQTFTFASAEGGTRVSIHVDMDADWWADLLGFLFRPMIQRLWGKYLATLKQQLEATG